MKIERDEDKIIFKFNAFKKLIVDKRRGDIEYWDGRIPIRDVRGYWKNQHPKGRKMVHYVMLLTPSKIHKITPEFESEDAVDEILKFLEFYLPLEVNE